MNRALTKIQLMERKEQLEIEVTEAHKQARELQADLEKANTTMQNAQQRCRELQQTNIQLQKQAEIAIATLQDEKSLNAKLQV